MINHGRTLLLNRNGAGRPEASFFLEEYVPVDFVAQTMPQYLASVHNILIGDGADDAYANYRVWQYMRLIHATEFVEYLLDLDPRVTYLTDRSVAQDSYLKIVRALNPASLGTAVFPVGDIPFDAATPRLQHDWVVEVLSPTLVRTSNVHSNEQIEHVVTVSSNLTDLIPMAGQSDFFVRIQSPYSTGARWSVSAFSKPDSDVTELIEPLGKVGNETLIRLFGNTEPYRTFKELWEKHFQVHYQLAGVVLAWIYRAEENRLNG